MTWWLTDGITERSGGVSRRSIGDARAGGCAQPLFRLPVRQLLRPRLPAVAQALGGTGAKAPARADNPAAVPDGQEAERQGEQAEQGDGRPDGLDADETYLLFPRESLAPDAPPLFRLLLAEPTLENARRYVRWYARRTARVQAVQALIRRAGSELEADNKYRRKTMTIPEIDKLAELLPERDPKGRFFWQDYVDRITGRFDGLPAPDGGKSFVRAMPLAVGLPGGACHGAQRAVEEPGAAGVGAPRSRRLRVPGTPGAVLRRQPALPGARRRAACGRGPGTDEWHPLNGTEPSYPAFLAAHGGQPEIAWSEAVPGFGEVCTGALFFFQRQEVLLVSPPLAHEVLSFLDPDRAAGLFGRMLSRDGQVDKPAVDVAACSWRPWSRGSATTCCGSTPRPTATCSSPRHSGC